MSERFPLKVAERIVRGIALQVCVLSAVALASRWPWLILILCVDFFLRAFVSPRYSPLRAISRLVGNMQAVGAMVSYSPKRFAAIIGFSLSSLSFALGISGMLVGFILPLSLLLLFSFLEAAFGLCVACKLYGLLIRFGLLPASSCPECVEG
jgi:hypothetical protein